MDSKFLIEHAARCRSLADKADEFTKSRLLDLAARYETELVNHPSRASSILKTAASFEAASAGNADGLG
jgi:hypothetical protein